MKHLKDGLFFGMEGNNVIVEVRSEASTVSPLLKRVQIPTSEFLMMLSNTGQLREAVTYGLSLQIERFAKECEEMPTVKDLEIIDEILDKEAEEETPFDHERHEFEADLDADANVRAESDTEGKE